VQADYAKFAKASPQRTENESSMTNSRQFIENTKPVPAPVEVKSTENGTIQTPDTETKA